MWQSACPALAERGAELSPEPSPEVQAMCRQADTSLPEGLLDTAYLLLFQKAPGRDLLMDFFLDYAENPARAELLDLVRQADESLQQARGLVDGALAYLDRYNQDDWHERFGANGFYQRLQRLRQTIVLFQAAEVYYRIRLSFFAASRQSPPDQASPGRQSFPDRSTALQAGLLLIDQWLSKPPSFSLEPLDLSLWRMRLRRALAFIDPDASPPAAEDDSPHNPAGGTDGAGGAGLAERLEYLRWLDPHESAATGRLDRLVLETNQLHLWASPDRADSRIQLQVALWLSIVRQHRLQQTTRPRALRERIFLSDRRYLEPLLDLAARDSQIRGQVESWIAARLAASIFQVASESDDADWPNLLKDADGSILLSLGRWFWTRRPPDWEAARRIYEVFLARETSRQPEQVAAALYYQGLCHRRLAERGGQGGQGGQTDQDDTAASDPAALGHILKAIETWNDLAVRFPDWSNETPEAAAGQSALAAAVQSAALAYQLCSRDPERYRRLARETLEILVGRIDPQTGRIGGPFSQTDAARSYRYFYGHVLLLDGQFHQAADMFATVPAGDPHSAEARFWRVNCAVKAAPAGDGGSAGTVEDYQDWLTALNALRAEQPPDALRQRVENLLVELLSQPQRRPIALGRLGGILNCRPVCPALLQLTIRMLHEDRTEQQEMLAGEELTDLQRLIERNLPVARQAYGLIREQAADPTGPTDPADAVLNTAAAQSYLETLCLAAELATPQTPCGGMTWLQICQAAQELLEEAAPESEKALEIWPVRCRARLEYARQRYESSRSLWHRIRQATQSSPLAANQYYHWEARYYSLLCLAALDRQDQVNHAVEVLLGSSPKPAGPWIDRITQLKH
ncbi:MAG: hypothetical protein JW810_00540 [Sedimentisphaerales bacterium]|nr:hypothetical protein [Sedimentisphaerales bacterium]